MLVVLEWKSKPVDGQMFKYAKYSYKGYFLLGIIPLYISRTLN